jgi:hypothetical protein
VTLASLFSPEAYEVLCRRSASPFYFWRIVAQAAELTTALPMQVADIERGIAETRYRWLIGTALGQAMMNTAIPSAARSTPADRQKMLLEGFMVARLGSTFDAADHSTMEANPLFA